jgi:hypothetical protein
LRKKNCKIINNYILKNALIITITLIYNKGLSQVFYTTNLKYLQKKPEQNNLLSNYSTSYPDSSINELSNFFPRNFMGNIGLPSPKYSIDYGTSEIGFKLYTNPQSINLFTEKEVDYLQTKGPFASLTGIAGTKQLQIFKLQFTTTFKNKLNLNLKFNRYGSLGFYLRQQTFINNFYVSSNYTSKNNRFGFYTYIFNNGTKNLENGGLKKDSLSDFDVTQSKDLYEVKISSAVRNNKEYKLMFNPWFKLNKTADSLSAFNHYIQIKEKFNFNSYNYKDDKSGTDNYYNLFYLDTSKTFDSTRVLQLISDVNYSLLKPNLNFGASLGYRNETNKVWQYHDSLFYNNLVTAEFVYRKSFQPQDTSTKNISKLEATINATYIFLGANVGNYKFEGKSTYTLTKNKTLYFTILFENRNADYIYNNWVSNHFQWFNNGFKPQQLLQAKLGYNYKKSLELSAVYENTYNYLLFDNAAYPRQYNSTLHSLSLNVGYTVILLKHIGLYINQIYQTTSNSSYINIPASISTARLYYTGNLFKNNLQLQIGTQCQRYSSFYGSGYDPAKQVFYIQDRTKTGEYFYTDAYINARIKPVQFFLKIENILQGIAGKNYALMPAYYQPDRAFRFGLTWLFFD